MTPHRESGRAIKVLWLIKGLDVGGAERLLVSCAGAADHQRFHYEAAFVVPSRCAFAPALEQAGIHVRCLGSENHFDLRWAFRLRRLLLAERYDIVHLHLPYATLIGTAVVSSLPKARRPHLVMTQHSMWRALSVATRLPNRFLMRRIDALVAVSKMTADSLPPALRHRTHVIVHGVPTKGVSDSSEDRGQVREELGIRENEVLITAVANFRADKGHDVLLAAARQLLDDGLPVRFAVVGHGELEEQVRALQAKLRLRDHVHLLGLRLDARRIVAASDIFVLSSRHEGFPVSLMEALASGVPVVATAVGGVPEAVTDGVEGLVVPPGRADLLAGALGRVVQDPRQRERMAAAARKRGATLDISEAVRRIEAIYEDLAG